MGTLEATPLPVYYIRHNWDDIQYQDAIDDLYGNYQIGVHFEDIKDGLGNITEKNEIGFNEKIYQKRSAKTSIRYMNYCSAKHEEVLVVANYLNKDTIYIGTPVKDSKKIKIISGLQIKYVQLKIIAQITIEDFPLPFLIPPPYSTFVEWDKGKQVVNAFCKGTKPSINTDTVAESLSGWLSPWHREVLCEEWLRECKEFKRKLYKTGGAMKYYDIVGINAAGKYVVAQVKHSCNDQDIISFLQKAENFEKYFFAPNINKLTSFNDIDSVISHETVINYFVRAAPEYLTALLSGRIIAKNNTN